MINTIAFSLEEIFEEIVEQGLMSSVTTEEAYHQLVEDVIEDRRGQGEISDDQNYEAYIVTLKARWPEYQARISA